MAPTIPTTVPATLVPGTTWEWTDSYDDFPPADYTLTYYFLGKTSFSLVATSGTAGYSVSVAPATTAAYEAGTYTWTAVAKDANAKEFPANSGVVVLEAAPKVAAATDARSFAEKMVANLEAELLARVTGDGSAHESWSIQSRTFQALDTAKLETMLTKYRLLVQCERNGGSLPPYKIAFARPT